MSANIITKLPNVFAWVEKQALVVMTFFTLFLIIINGYLMLGHRYNEGLILQQILLVIICLSLFFVATQLHDFKRYSRVFRVIMIILMIASASLFLVYQHYFQSLYNNSSYLWIESDRFYALVLLLLATLVFGLLPFILAHEKDVSMMHNIIVSFCLLPVVITALILYINNHMESFITIYEFDFNIIQHKVKVSLLFACVAWIVVAIVQKSYQKLVHYLPKITGLLMLLITISYLGILIYIVINADKLRMMIAVSYW